MNQIVRLIIGGLMIGCVYGVLGMAYSLVYKATGLMNLAQGEFLMIGAFLGLTFYKIWGLPYAVAIVLTFAVMFALGWLVQVGLITKLLKRGATFAYIILCTAAISMILQNGALVVWGAIPLYFPSIFPVTTVKFFGVNVAPEQPRRNVGGGARPILRCIYDNGRTNRTEGVCRRGSGRIRQHLRSDHWRHVFWLPGDFYVGVYHYGL